MIANIEWDDLLERSRCDTVFLRSSFLRAAQRAFADRLPLVTIRASDPMGQLLGGALFVVRGRSAELLGTGPSDYLDIPIDATLPNDLAAQLQRKLIEEFFHQNPAITSINLCHMVEGRETPANLTSLQGLHLTTLRTMPAPRIDRTGILELAKRASLRRPDNRLARIGRVSCHHFRSANEILPRLDPFFEQHVERWKGTSSPSLFEVPAQRDFYRILTSELSDAGWLRYTEIRLDDVLAAAHFGFSMNGSFIWYKPSFNPKLAELSPGVVLIRRLLLLAMEEGAEEFDFTIGDEDFKRRYATEERVVHDINITRSHMEASLLRAKIRLRRGAREGLEQLKLLKARTKKEPLPPVVETTLACKDRCSK